MRVDFYGTYRLITTQKTIDFPLNPGVTLLSLLHSVVCQFPALRDEIFDGRGNIYPYIPLYLNGRNPRLLQGGFDTALTTQDVLSIFSPISSGRINVEDANHRLSG